MKERLFIIVSVVLIFLLVLSSCSRTFDGYYYNLKDARKAEKVYDQYDYLFTAEHDNAIVDFVIQGEKLHIIKINRRGKTSENQFKVKATGSYYLKLSIYDPEIGEQYRWHSTGKALIIVEWLIVPKAFNHSDENHECFEFVYADEVYCLCYRFGE